MKDPAVLFYTQDFLTGTILMTDEQRGKYITLLCLQHQNGGLTEKEMLKICGSFDEDIFKKFDCIEGKYYNKRMTLEINKRHNFIESRRKNLSKKSDMDVHTESHKVNRMENENEDININEDEKKKREELLKKREEKFCNEVYYWENTEKYPREMLQKFYDYWTEMNRSKTKMRFELEKTFEISKRLVTWASRDNKFNKDIPSPKTHEEMLKMAETNPEIWKSYKVVKREGERKATYYPINICLE